jgi:hypothetical protein
MNHASSGRLLCSPILLCSETQDFFVPGILLFVDRQQAGAGLNQSVEQKSGTY